MWKRQYPNKGDPNFVSLDFTIIMCLILRHDQLQCIRCAASKPSEGGEDDDDGIYKVLPLSVSLSIQFTLSVQFTLLVCGYIGRRCDIHGRKKA